jgi:chaperonin GroES
LYMKKAIDKVIVVGDKVLVKPKSPDKLTKAGLYLPPGVQEKESIQTGYVIKTGPGYPIPAPKDTDEVWKKKEPEHFPLQCKEGDLAVYLQRDAYEIEIENEKYFIVPQHAILLLFRDDD